MIDLCDHFKETLNDENVVNVNALMSIGWFWKGFSHHGQYRFVTSAILYLFYISDPRFNDVYSAFVKSQIQICFKLLHIIAMDNYAEL